MKKENQLISDRLINEVGGGDPRVVASMGKRRLRATQRVFLSEELVLFGETHKRPNNFADTHIPVGKISKKENTDGYGRELMS